ncbi:MAG TPA: D-Ala-D-Ala carboxypeptidase family metallohydrolase, partial [Labilithrix sp.]|nr:D-Ala-D-Ala carboxypeptidase family metallohydrolase [Labilithrix sp.]
SSSSSASGGGKKYDGNVTDGKLSEHFTLAEFTTSSTANKKGIKNTPKASEIAAMKALCDNVLEKVRTHFGASVAVSSGFRCEKLNTAIGGSTTSQHVKGEAADFTVSGKTVKQVFNYIAFESKMPFDQVIFEFNRWVHVSYTTGTNRKEILEAYSDANGKTKYRNIKKPM